MLSCCNFDREQVRLNNWGMMDRWVERQPSP